jgi:hypothetical protein
MKRIELEHLLIYMLLKYEEKGIIDSATIIKEFNHTSIEEFTVNEELYNENIDIVRNRILTDLSVYTLID